MKEEPIKTDRQIFKKANKISRVEKHNISN